MKASKTAFGDKVLASIGRGRLFSLTAIHVLAGGDEGDDMRGTQRILTMLVREGLVDLVVWRERPCYRRRFPKAG